MTGEHQNYGGMPYRSGHQRGGRGGRGHRGGMQHRGGGHMQGAHQMPHYQQQQNMATGYAYPPQVVQNTMGPAYNQQFPPMMHPAAQMQPQPQMQQPGTLIIGLPQYDQATFENIKDVNEKKQFIGNIIYSQIEQTLNADFAGKITGMLLDEEAVEIERLLKDQVYLSKKAGEAH